MTSGRENQLTGQCGEYLVAAELCRKGYVNTTFTGNMPDFDIIAINKKGILKRIQVKTSRNDSFPISLLKYVEIEIKGELQIIKGKKPLKNPDIINIFVKLEGQLANKKDRFYIMTETELQNLSERVHKTFLNKHGGKRPRNPDSLVHRIFLKDLHEYKDRWDKLEG